MREIYIHYRTFVAYDSFRLQKWSQITKATCHMYIIMSSLQRNESNSRENTGGQILDLGSTKVVSQVQTVCKKGLK